METVRRKKIIKEATQLIEVIKHN